MGKTIGLKKNPRKLLNPKRSSVKTISGSTNFGSEVFGSNFVSKNILVHKIWAQKSLEPKEGLDSKSFCQLFLTNKITESKN